MGIERGPSIKASALRCSWSVTYVEVHEARVVLVFIAIVVEEVVVVGLDVATALGFDIHPLLDIQLLCVVRTTASTSPQALAPTKLRAGGLFSPRCRGFVYSETGSQR